MNTLKLLREIFSDILCVDVIYNISKFLPRTIRPPPPMKKIKYKTQRVKHKYHYYYH